MIHGFGGGEGVEMGREAFCVVQAGLNEKCFP